MKSSVKDFDCQKKSLPGGPRALKSCCVPSSVPDAGILGLRAQLLSLPVGRPACREMARQVDSEADQPVDFQRR